jgi:hypothetical protein
MERLQLWLPSPLPAPLALHRQPLRHPIQHVLLHIPDRAGEWESESDRLGIVCSTPLTPRPGHHPRDRGQAVVRLPHRQDRRRLRRGLHRYLGHDLHLGDHHAQDARITPLRVRPVLRHRPGGVGGRPRGASEREWYLYILVQTPSAARALVVEFVR